MTNEESRVRIRCPGCQAMMDVKSKLAGQAIKCSKCGMAGRVPSAEVAKAESPPSASRSKKRPAPRGSKWTKIAVCVLAFIVTSVVLSLTMLDWGNPQDEDYRVFAGEKWIFRSSAISGGTFIMTLAHETDPNWQLIEATAESGLRATILQRRTLKDGSQQWRADGHCKFRQPDGSLVFGSFRNGAFDGAINGWFANGQKWFVGEMQGGLVDGEYREWHNNGLLAARFVFDEGEQLSAEFFNESGKQISDLEAAELGPPLFLLSKFGR